MKLAKLGALVAAAALALTVTACSEQSSGDAPPPPPPPPAAFGTVHDWGGGNSVRVEGPRNQTLPGPLQATLVQVKVHNGGQSAVAANAYRADVAVNGVGKTATAFGVAAVPNGQVQSNSDADFTVMFEAAPAGATLDVTVTGPNLPAVTYSGTAP